MRTSPLMNLLIVNLLTVLMLPVVSTAQTNVLFKNEKIRIMAPEQFRTPITGQVVDVRNDSLTFVIGRGRQFTIPFHRIRKLEVVRGTKSNKRKGALLGAVSGGLGLGILFVADVSGEQGGWFVPTPGQAFVGGLIFGGLVGSLTGGIIGSGSRSPRWMEVPVENLTIAEKTLLHPPEVKPPLKSKERIPRVPKSQRRWRLTLSSGNCSRGPVGDIEQAMRRDGFDDTSPGGWFGGPVDHPFSNTGFGAIGIPWTMELSYTLKRHYNLALLLTQTPMGETIGYRRNPGLGLVIKYDVTTISPMFIYTPNGIMRLGIGPAWVIYKIEHDSGEKISYREQKGRPGAVLQASLLYPTHTRFFLKADFQYRWIPGETFGPIPTQSEYYEVSLPLNKFTANFSHTYFGLGIGVQLF